MMATGFSVFIVGKCVVKVLPCSPSADSLYAGVFSLTGVTSSQSIASDLALKGCKQTVFL